MSRSEVPVNNFLPEFRQINQHHSRKTNCELSAQPPENKVKIRTRCRPRRCGTKVPRRREWSSRRRPFPTQPQNVDHDAFLTAKRERILASQGNHTISTCFQHHHRREPRHSNPTNSIEQDGSDSLQGWMSHDSPGNRPAQLAI
jgi:hypothetical protein